MVVSLEEAAQRMEELSHLAVAGQEVILVSREGDRLRLQPEVGDGEGVGDRVSGILKGRLGEGPEFFEELSEEELALWYEGDDLGQSKYERMVAKAEAAKAREAAE